MQREQIFMGEPVTTGSQYISESEAVNNAGFGAYGYGPGNGIPQDLSLPGWQGYSTNPNNNNGYYNPMGYQQPNNGYGIGANPYQQQQFGYNPYQNSPGQNPYQQQQFGYNPYQNNPGANPIYQQQQFGYNPYQNNPGANPIYQQQYNPYQNNPGANPIYQNNNCYGGGIQYVNSQPTQPNIPKKIKIQGISFGGEYLPPMNFEDKMMQIQLKYIEKEMEERENGYCMQNGYNYYNSPYSNQNNSAYREMMEEINEMKEKARQNRIKLNLQLSIFAHNNIYGEGNYDLDALKERYYGKEVDNPVTKSKYEDYYEAHRFDNMVPFDNSQFYRNYSAQITAEHNKIINPNSNLAEFFRDLGVLGATYAMEEERKKRRNYSNMFDASDSGYLYYLKRKVRERRAEKQKELYSGGIYTGYESFNNNLRYSSNPAAAASVNNNFYGNRYNNGEAPLNQQCSSDEERYRNDLAKDMDVKIKRALLEQFPLLSTAMEVDDDGNLHAHFTEESMRKAKEMHLLDEEPDIENQFNEDRFIKFVESIPKSIKEGGSSTVPVPLGGGG